MKFFILAALLLAACAGPKGDTGAQGLQGNDGSQGLTGTSVTTIKFCADDSTQFPEYGLRIGSEIYGVYWDASKGAFLALIVPGNYMSTNGTGCTFSVDAEGNVL